MAQRATFVHLNELTSVDRLLHDYKTTPSKKEEGTFKDLSISGVFPRMDIVFMLQVKDRISPRCLFRGAQNHLFHTLPLSSYYTEINNAFNLCTICDSFA